MGKPWTPERFAEYVGIPLERALAYQRAELLDPDGDGLMDDFDVLRVGILETVGRDGSTVEEVLAELKDSEHSVLTRRLFPIGTATYNAAEVAEATGFSMEQLEELSAAWGSPVGDSIDESDLESLRRARRFLDLGVPWEGIVEAARVYADALRRIAQAEIRMIHRLFCESLARAGATEQEISHGFYQVGPMMTELSQELIRHGHEDFLIRALIDHALTHLEAADPEQLPGSTTTTILFVDLALFTPLAQAHGDELAAQMLDRFDAIVRRRCLARSGTLVKQIGDAFMLTFDDPVEAVRFGLEVIDEAAHEENFLALRIGVHSGRVLYRVGDYIGNAVNIASRVTSMAMPNTILMTEPVAVAAREQGMEVEEVGLRRVRGVEDPLVIYRAAAKPVTDHDPVCGMIVSSDAVARLTHDGRQFAFCSEDCLRKFLEDPDRYTAAADAS